MCGAMPFVPGMYLGCDFAPDSGLLLRVFFFFFFFFCCCCCFCFVVVVVVVVFMAIQNIKITHHANKNC